MFSTELLWCLVFVQKSNFQEKSRKISQSSYFTRRLTEPENEMERGHEGPHHLVARARPDRARGWFGRLSHRLEPSFRLHIASDLETSGVGCFSQKEFRCAITTRNRDSELETPFWHPAGMNYWRRSLPSSSPMPLGGAVLM
jgi:hypothetical protein